MIILNLPEFLEEIRPTIKFSSSTGYHFCSGCGRQFDSTEKLLHWPKHCSLSKDKKIQKLRADVLSENFPEEEKPTLQEVGLDWYQKQIKITESLPMDFKPTGSPIDETMYPATEARKLSARDIQDLRDLFSGKIKCEVKQVYTGNKIIDEIPMADEPDPNLFDWPIWAKDHHQAVAEIRALGLYPDLIKNGECDLPDCKCHWVADQKSIKNMEEELA